MEPQTPNQQPQQPQPTPPTPEPMPPQPQPVPTPTPQQPPVAPAPQPVIISPTVQPPAGPGPVAPVTPPIPQPQPVVQPPAAPPTASQPPVAPPAALGPVAPPPSAPEPSQPPKKRAWLWVMAAIIILVLIVFGVDLLLGQAGKNTSQTSTGSTGETSQQQTGTAAKNSCELLPADLVSQVLGASVQYDTADSQANNGMPTTGYTTNGSYCSYISDDLISRALIQSYYPGTEGKAGVVNHYKEIKSSNAKTAPVEQLSGIADDAYWYEANSTIYALKGDVSVDITVFLPSEKQAQVKPAAESLLRTMLGKI